jgi:Zn finger protein HypA/HybF involved in hydrogenase expression
LIAEIRILDILIGMSKRKTTEEFICGARLIHGNEYDYSLAVYIKATIKVKIICKLHGVFEQPPNRHLRGAGCFYCGVEKVSSQRLKTTDFFIKKSIEAHCNEYDYSKSIYTGQNNKLIIICKSHGEFNQAPATHWKGSGCPKCAKKKTKKLAFTTESFIQKARSIHGDLFDYSKSVYTGRENKIIIICRTCNYEFLKSPSNHIYGQGCVKCANRKKSADNLRKSEDYFSMVKDVHGNDYSYNNSVYLGCKSKIEIKCNTCHFIFWQEADAHLYGNGCPNCKAKNISNSLNELYSPRFVEKAKRIHGEKFDYSKSKYITLYKTVIIICNTCNTEFEQTPQNHYRSNICCPKCISQRISDAQKSTKEYFMDRARDTHGDTYDYSKCEYLNANSKVILICKAHGEFKQNAANHLNGYGCPKCRSSISKSERDWLDSIKVPEEYRQKILRINGKIVRTDAYDPETNTIYEFYGDFWHGNPRVFDKNKLNDSCKKTFAELYEKTTKKEDLIKSAGYNLITIWEKDWKDGKKKSAKKLG